MMNEVTTAERTGRWMPFRFLYFSYYVLCRRDKFFMPNAVRPAVTASYSFVFLMGWPIVAILALLNHFTGWQPVWAQWWLAMGLPNAGDKTSAYSFMAVVVVVDLILYWLIFNKRRYAWIMQQFDIYDPISRTIAPAMLFLVPMIPVAGLAIYTVNSNPIRGNLIIWSILVVNEVVFRIWWHLWLRQHPITP